MTVRSLALAFVALVLGEPAAAGEPAACIGPTWWAGETACAQTSDRWEGDPAARSAECVQFGRDKDGATVLVNPCVECRRAEVERIDIAGNLSFRNYPVAPKSSVDLPVAGLARARILRDNPCR